MGAARGPETGGGSSGGEGRRPKAGVQREAGTRQGRGRSKEERRETRTSNFRCCCR